MNPRPTHANRAPAPSETVVEVEEVTTIAPERVNHAPPAVRREPSHDQQAVAHTTAPAERWTIPQTSLGKITKAIASVMADIKPVEKSGWNDFHKYDYARMQDLSTALTPLMGKHGIVVFQNEVDRSMFDENRVIAVRYEFTIIHESGEIWPERPLVTGMAACRTSNGKFDDKAFNKAHTSARKYFLIGLFQIPTEDHDDADRDEGSGRRPRPQNRRPPAPDGSLTPDVVPITHGEHPADWAKRFIKAIETAKSSDDIDKWYDANFAIFEKVKRHVEGPAIYDSLIKAMDDQTAKLAAPPPAELTTKPRQRAPTPKPVADSGVSADEWIASIENAYSGCESAAELATAQSKYMMPFKGKVTEEMWHKAVQITQDALKRIEDTTSD